MMVAETDRSHSRMGRPVIAPAAKPLGSAMQDIFLLKLLAVEAAILITVGLLAVMGHDYFAWLLS
jgi:hypothetical protein